VTLVPAIDEQGLAWIICAHNGTNFDCWREWPNILDQVETVFTLIWFKVMNNGSGYIWHLMNLIIL